MEEFNSTKIIKKYKTALWVSTLTLLAIFYYIIFTDIDITKTIICFLIFYLLLKLTKVFIYSKYVDSVLTSEFNPKKYKAILEDGDIISRHAMERINAAFYNGDYQTVADICTLKLKDKKFRKYKLAYLTVLGRTYFILQDFEKLRLVCQCFERTAESHKNPEAIRKKFPIFEMFSLYLRGNFIDCKELYEKLLTKKRTTSTKWNEVHTRFIYAIICHKCHYFDLAKLNFSYVICSVPKFNLADIAEKYLTYSEKGEEYTPEQPEILPTENFSLPAYEKIKKRLLVLNIIIAAFMIMMLTVMVLYYIGIANYNVPL